MEVMSGESHIISLNEGRNWYDMNILNPGEEYTLLMSDKSVKFYGFEVLAAE